jgi:hypothetical protein
VLCRPGLSEHVGGLGQAAGEPQQTGQPHPELDPLRLQVEGPFGELGRSGKVSRGFQGVGSQGEGGQVGRVQARGVLQGCHCPGGVLQQQRQPTQLAEGGGVGGSELDGVAVPAQSVLVAAGVGQQRGQRGHGHRIVGRGLDRPLGLLEGLGGGSAASQ